MVTSGPRLIPRQISDCLQKDPFRGSKPLICRNLTNNQFPHMFHSWYTPAPPSASTLTPEPVFTQASEGRTQVNQGEGSATQRPNKRPASDSLSRTDHVTPQALAAPSPSSVPFCLSRRGIAQHIPARLHCNVSRCVSLFSSSPRSSSPRPARARRRRRRAARRG